MEKSKSKMKLTAMTNKDAVDETFSEVLNAGDRLVSFFDLGFKRSDIQYREKALNYIEHCVRDGLLDDRLPTFYDVASKDSTLKHLDPEMGPFWAGFDLAVTANINMPDHPYFYFMRDKLRLSISNPSVLRKMWVDYSKLQEHLEFAAALILDADLLPELTTQQRYMMADDNGLLELNLYLENLPYGFKTKNIISGQHASPILKNMFDTKTAECVIDVFKKTTQETHDQLKGYYGSTNPDYRLRSPGIIPAELAILDFYAMVQFGVKIRRCRECKKYFVVKGDYDQQYCERPRNNEKNESKNEVSYTCRNYGNQRDSRDSLKKDDLKLAYSRARGRIRKTVDKNNAAAKEFYGKATKLKKAVEINLRQSKTSKPVVEQSRISLQRDYLIKWLNEANSVTINRADFMNFDLEIIEGGLAKWPK